MPIAYDDQYILRPNHQVEFTREMVMELQKCAMDVEYFAEHFYTIIHPKKGKMLIQLYGFQKEMIRNFANNRFNIVLSARQMGKALSLDTPILTPNGFKNMGDISIGDEIYGRDGKKTKVSFITNVMDNKKMYEVEFDNGEVIKACSEHLWNVSTSDWERYAGEKTLTTIDLIELHKTLEKRNSRPFVHNNKPIEFDEQKLEIHPYVLGLWLGDGNKNDGRINCNDYDYLEYRKILNSFGYEVGEFKRDKRRKRTGRFNIVGLKAKLRKIGLLGSKVIPNEYMFNTYTNRISLIQGLMDSDGSSEKNGTLRFFQTSTPFTDQVSFILNSLGIKVKKTCKKGKKKDSWILTFINDRSDMFRISRKLERQYSKKHNHPKNFRNYIVSIKEIDTVPCRCLQVDNDEHLFLCGNSLIPTHNTTCSCIYLLWYAIFNTDKDIAILANQQSTAASIVADIKAAYEMLPAFMKPGVKKYDNLTIVFDNGTRVFARATSENALRGESVSLLFLDEFAFVPENIAEGFWAANLPVISTGGDIIVVSTPNGSAGLYYELWKKANAKQTDTAGNTWNPQRIRWDEHPDRDDNWKQEMLGSIGKVRFAQEFDCSFTGSTYTLIDGAILESMYPDDPAFIPEEGYHMWKRPEPGHLYAIGVDVAKGANTDYHVANIYDVTNHHKTGKYEQVAIFRRNDISVFDFQEKIIDIGKQWNEAVLIIENNNLGHAVVNEVYFEVGYENCFYDYDKGEYGINANKKTKPLALSYFKEDVETSRMKIHSDAMINELGFYEEVRTGVFQARSGREFHDDTVASGYWVSYLLRSRYWEDYLDWWIQNNDPDQQRLQSMLENDAVENDQSVADGFLKALGNPGMGDDYERDQFLRDLSM